MEVVRVGEGEEGHLLPWYVSNNVLSAMAGFCELNTDPTGIVGNGGTETGNPKIENLDIKVEDVYSQIVWAQKTKPDLVVVGPEVPLVYGVEEHFRMCKSPIPLLMSG